MTTAFIIGGICIAAFAILMWARFNLARRPVPPTHDNTPGSKPPSPFDAESRKPYPDRRVLEGRAYVVDGDTLILNRTQVRLFGVDAPELHHPYGKAAKWELAGLCQGQSIQAEVIDEDKFGRTVAKCYLPDGRDLSAEMVKREVALDWPKFSNGQYGALETETLRKKLWLADARQKGRMQVWAQFESRQGNKKAG